MTDIYRNSVFTIASIDKPTDEHGIFRNRSYKPRPQRVQTAEDSMIGYFDYDHPHHHISTHARELDTRGWCLQEQLLSPRTLSYADGELFWSCKTMSASESFPGGYSDLQKGAKMKTFTHTDSQLLKGLVIANNQNGPLKKKETAYQLWRLAVEDFMSRALTAEKDRLVAVSGISAALASYLEDDLVAGIWKKELPRHLLWWPDTIMQPNQFLRRPQSFEVPSWSWGSVIGDIVYKQIGVYRSESDDIHDLGSLGGSFEPAMIVKDVDLQSVPHGIHGRVTASGSLIKAFARDSDNGSCLYYSGWRSIHYHGRRIFLSPSPPPTATASQTD